FSYGKSRTRYAASEEAMKAAIKRRQKEEPVGTVYWVSAVNGASIDDLTPQPQGVPMAFRFQRRISLAPGVRLNISKRGVGLSV
ncbi:DUF4236 domain-containing protein, partial [Micrococcus sp. SIMBA_144]